MVVAVGAAAVPVWRWLAEPHVLLETVLYSIVGGVVVASVAVVAVVLRRELRQVPLRPKMYRLDAPAQPAVAAPRRVVTAVSAPVQQQPIIINSQPPAIVHNHLQIEGITAAELAAAIAARNVPAREQHAIEENS